VLGVGLVCDLVTALFLLAPFALYLILLPERIHRSRWHGRLIGAAGVLTLFGIIYLGAAEYFFFDEFDARFNFVAVEYLIYPHEVFINIWDSYPVARVLASAVILTGVLAWVMRGRFTRSDPVHLFRHRLVFGAVLTMLLAVAHAGLNINSGRFSDNRVVNELALNGVYSFFNAARHSDMDYPAFYLTMSDEEADERLRRVVSPDASYHSDAEHVERHVVGHGVAHKLNVVVLLQESLGAEFVGAYGDDRGLTPNIDRLVLHSLVFDQAYATGTRTVRGMEAVTASFPPIPAESLVKRPYNEGLFNWSTVMSRNGYSPTFIYGGYGSFDNMNHFFGSNGYRVIDRTDMDDPGFANIWGVSDEDLFRKAVRTFDDQHRSGERIFSVVMSTSNHKPFTFPAGITNVPQSGGGRDAGVRYADYAIGKFFELAETRAWFDDTLFVIVADHGARVYGREDIPVRTYEIPLLVYSPKHVKAGHVMTLTSQIDIAPTILGILNLDYESVFFGVDVLNESRPGRMIPFNHNRDIAMFDGYNLVEIGFRKTAAQFAYDRKAQIQRPMPVDPELLKDVIAFFQEGHEVYYEHIYTSPQ
jgi:phosphoglycerol transferase MdoB-like AlkP superfamily enzyme